MIKNKIIILFLVSLMNGAENLSKINNFSFINEESSSAVILFEPNDIEIKSENGKSKFITHDMIGLSMDEGKPQFPVYSTLFQIDPTKKYDFELEVLESYYIDDIEFENYKNDNNSDYSIYPDKNLYISEPQIWRDIVLNQIGITPYKYLSLIHI